MHPIYIAGAARSSDHYITDSGQSLLATRKACKVHFWCPPINSPILQEHNLKAWYMNTCNYQGLRRYKIDVDSNFRQCMVKLWPSLPREAVMVTNLNGFFF